MVGTALMLALAPARPAPAITGQTHPAAPDPAMVGLGTTPLACGVGFQVQCSGVVIGPRLVLTAAHCVRAGLHTGYFQILVPGAAGAAADTIDVVASHVHPSYVRGDPAWDLAVVVAARSLPGPAARWTTAPLTAADATGTPAEIHGFGSDRAGGEPGRQSMAGRVAIDSIGERTIRLLPAPNMLCGGDSGGALLVAGANGRELVGILSQSDDRCMAWGIAVRLDEQVRAFVMRTPPVPPEAPGRVAPPPGAPNSYERLCTSSCQTDADCPARTSCRLAEPSVRRCMFDSLLAGEAAGPCGATACERCIQLPGRADCACYRPCATGAADDAAGGCTIAGGGDGGQDRGGLLTMTLAWAAGALLWRRRSARLRAHPSNGDISSLRAHLPSADDQGGALPTGRDVPGRLVVAGGQRRLRRSEDRGPRPRRISASASSRR